VKRQATQQQVERAHRIRLLSRGVQVEGATDAERQAAAKRRAAAQQRRNELEAENST
jgi:hypothetical protein